MARPLGVRALREVRSLARKAAEERKAAVDRQRGGEGRVKQSLSGPVVGGQPEMKWRIAVVVSQGNPTEVPIEWVNEAVRRMLAMENVIRRAVSGMPLELRYPAPRAQLAQVAASRRTQDSTENTEDDDDGRGDDDNDGGDTDWLGLK
ncbi:hypothetical protein RHMOL_Rhmol04G0219300 [Rhododendron molle]|uniref:Uncharacterized protein n=1 Tax=Rhododendron molle TaxID=49168 RepID=A0ACC0P4A7_RHOML|nr:hypothetical protein RHMOL_Rhmol04G0219300 [Rhododendron molle]